MFVQGGSGLVQNGPGDLTPFNVNVKQVLHGDFTHTGVPETVVVLECTSGNGYGAEIQVFTDSGVLIQRLLPPGGTETGGAFPPAFDLTNIFDSNFDPSQGDNLITGVSEWAPADAHCCPSGGGIYRWIWNGNAFNPAVNNLGTD